MISFRIGVGIATGLLALGAVAAVALWVGDGPPPVSVRECPDREDLQLARLEAESSRAEAAALRAELDRLLSRLRQRSPKAPWAPETRSDVETPRPPPEPSGELRELAARYGDLLARSLAGDETARDEAYEVAVSLAREGPEAFPPLREAYLATDDPEVRALMLRAMIPGADATAQEFIAAELESATDPVLRAALAARAASLSNVSNAEIFRGALLDVLARDGDTATRAAAVRGLAPLRGDPTVDGRLLEAAASGEPEVRAEAYAVLARHPGLRDELSTLVTAERDPRLRDIGECRLLLSE